MKNSSLIGLAVGMIIGAVGVSYCKPAQNAVKKGTEFVKDEAEMLINKTKQSSQNEN